MTGEVLVVGAINVDLVVTVGRLPGPGETVVGQDLARHGGGKGANAAVAAVRAGARVRLIGAVGADDLGTQAMGELRDEGVVVDDVSVLEGVPTGVALIVVSADGENQIAVAAGANGAIDPQTVRTAIERARASARCVIVSTEINGPAVVAAVEAATQAGIACLLNPAPVIPEVVDLLDLGPILTPNAHECAALAAALGDRAGADGRTPVQTPGVGSLPDGGPREVDQKAVTHPAVSHPGVTHPAVAHPAVAHQAVADAALTVVAHTGAPVVVTLGGDGVLVVQADGRIDLVAPHPTAVVDTTGAGDTFNGVLGTWLGRGESLAAAVGAATVAASLSVAAAGARRGMPAAPMIEKALQQAEASRSTTSGGSET